MKLKFSYLSEAGEEKDEDSTSEDEMAAKKWVNFAFMKFYMQSLILIIK